MRFHLLLALFAVAGCQSGLQPGEVELGLTGHTGTSYVPYTQPTKNDVDDIAQAVVLVKEVDARVANQWTTLTTTPREIDLLALDGKTFTSLGVTKLPSGHVNELRLVLDEVGDYVVLKSGVKKPLEVPDNGVLKVVGKIDLDACASGVVILDFDPHLKTEREGARVEYEVKATVTIKAVEQLGTCNPVDLGKPADLAKPAPDLAGKPDAGAADAGGGGGTLCGGVVCAPGEACQAGKCVADPCSGVICAPTEMCVNGACVTKATPDLGSGSSGGSCHPDGGACKKP